MDPMYFYLYVAANATTQHTPVNECEWSYNATITIVGVVLIAIALLICWVNRNNN